MCFDCVALVDLEREREIELADSCCYNGANIMPGKDKDS